MSNRKTRIVKFARTVTVRDAEGTTFEADKSYELPEASAARWVRRKLAEYVTEPVATAKPAGFKGMPKAFDVDGGAPVPAEAALARAIEDAGADVTSWNRLKADERKARILDAVDMIIADRAGGEG